jgi:hypothetical protein
VQQGEKQRHHVLQRKTRDMTDKRSSGASKGQNRIPQFVSRGLHIIPASPSSSSHIARPLRPVCHPSHLPSISIIVIAIVIVIVAHARHHRRSWQ